MQASCTKSRSRQDIEEVAQPTRHVAMIDIISLGYHGTTSDVIGDFCLGFE